MPPCFSGSTTPRNPLECLVEKAVREFSEGMAVALFDVFRQLPGGKRSGQLLERFQVAPE
jgi:hypothetical protein